MSEQTVKWSTLAHAKINGLVHQHVFNGDFIRACTGEVDVDGFCERCRKMISPNGPHAITIATPDYSGDIRDAWRIVEHYHNVQIHFMSPGTNRYGGTYMVVINGCHRGLGHTVMEALCKAALSACAIDIEE